ncbi:MAG: rRNA methylase [Acidimicrobiales bacterium]|nr:rRNA methylase [Acidimicrobiales bacterium]
MAVGGTTSLTTPRLLSARNPRIARLARLARRRSARADEQAFLVEGPTLIAEALAAGWPLAELYVEPGRASSDDDLVTRVEAAGGRVWQVPDGTLARAGDATTSQGALAVAPWRAAAWPDPTSSPLVLVLVDVADPGNAGTLLRAAEASGAGAVVVAGRSVDPTNPKCVRSSAGALFHVPVVVEPDTVGALERIGSAGYRRVSTRVRDAAPYDAVDLTGPVAVIVGNEAHGLEAGLSGAVDEPVTIPMVGRSESLNVAMAGSIICFEVLRQRRAMEEGR